MATVSVIKLKIRRGTDHERRQITLDVGEVGYTTDASSRRLFVGDGSTKGGNPAGIKFISGDIQNPDPSLTTAQVGDIVFNATDNRLYVLSGINLQNFPNYAVASAYQFIGTYVDNYTIEYRNDGFLQIKDGAIGNAQINNSAFDYNKGFTRNGLTGPIQINYDDNTIKVIGGALTVNQAAINFGSINTAGQGIDASNLSFNYLPGAAGVPGTNRLWRDSSGYLRIS
jgi:hypothetical protein